jgi:DNA-binding LytR/AlgR family response regulator
MEDHLRSNRIVRVHKSYMVAINKIDHMERTASLKVTQIIPISETYSERFFQNGMRNRMRSVLAKNDTHIKHFTHSINLITQLLCIKKLY